MNKVKINGSYTETLKYLQENLNPAELKDYKYLKALKKVQELALKESIGKTYIDPLCDLLIRNKLVGHVKDRGILNVLNSYEHIIKPFLKENYTNRKLKTFGDNVVRPNEVDFTAIRDIKEQLIEFKKEEANEEASKFFNNQDKNDMYESITFRKLIESYYSDFSYIEGYNTPSLKKQLTSQNIAFREQDLVIWGEVKAWFDNYYTGKPNFHRGYLYRTLLYDYLDDEIKDISKKWSFAGSCHSLHRSGGQTPKMLKAIGFKMLKFYCLNTDGELVPSARTYYYQSGENIAFSGTYTNFGNDEMATSGYAFTKAIMCYIFQRKFEDFDKIEGMEVNTSELEDAGFLFFSNMSQDNNYAKFGTADILKNIHIDADDAYYILKMKRKETHKSRSLPLHRNGV